MKICIIGWYGTETIGDRAILSGILSYLHDTIIGSEILLGSLYPFFTERTLDEDGPFYKEALKSDIKIDLFNSKKRQELDRAISSVDLVVMGGGPLMHVNALFMVEYAFKRAKKLGKKTMIFGCGVGPFFKKRHKRSLINIVRNSDLTILRDQGSKEYLARLFKEFSRQLNDEEIHTSLDPSVKSLLDVREIEAQPSGTEPYIAVNLREFPGGYLKEDRTARISEILIRFIADLADSYEGLKIRLIPMHYFHVGNDDREFLNLVRFTLNKPNIEVQNQNLPLLETMRTFAGADFAIGMRFHSVVFQTMLNGKNFVLDYTDPKTGKIGAFLRDLNAMDFYSKRYANLQSDSELPGDFIPKQQDMLAFEPDIESIRAKLDVYPKMLKALA